ncbi:transglutaminase TgpA family protein [Aeromonas salmonicida]|uniref:transglutaminase TgpA family protein n=1 Tax=Aeromonas salmonicida TaxID=645 RepID=UPI003CFCD985
MLLDNRRLLPLIALQQGVLVLALWPQLQLWVVAVGAITLGVRAMMLWQEWRSPPARALALLAITGVLLLVWQWRALGTLPALINLLWLGYSLKMIEVRRERDIEQVLLLAFFLIALALVQRQSMGWALAMAATLWLTVSTLVTAVAPEQRQPWRSAGASLLLALPLLLTLFLVLPRLPPLWQMPTTSRALSGLSEEVAPGDISELVNSSELAFRVTFADGPPPASERYFPVMRQEQFDGRRWLLSAETRQWQQSQPMQTIQVQTGAGPLPPASYEVIAEPQRHRWTLALSQPSVLLGPVLVSPLATLYRRDRGDQRISYRVTAAPTVLPADTTTLRRNLQLPAAGNPRARAHAQALKARHPVRAELVAALLDGFRREPFYYTLQPPLLGPDGVDDFLFNSRRGFCGHYAMATAFVLRAAGIPARLVTGYLGGEWNPQGQYLEVHQFDAHAWVEYLDDSGNWQRLDPTAAVAPQRVEGGMTAALSEEFTAADPLSLQRYRQWALLNQLRWWGANLDYQWTRRVLNYDAARLWQQVGLRWPALASHTPWLILTCLLGVATLIGTLLLWPGRALPHLKVWKPLLRRAARQGWQPHAGESLASWCERLITLDPELAQPLQRCAWLYRRWRYAPLSEQRQQQTLRQLQRRLRQTCQLWDKRR